MRVLARRVHASDAPADVRPYLGQSFVTADREYEVHAVALFERVVLVLVVDDKGHPSWRPTWLFDMRDASVPSDWICNLFHEDPLTVMGPEFIARDQASYVAMVEQDPEPLRLFRERVSRPGR